MKKNYLLLSLLIMMSLILGACGGAIETPTEPAAPEPVEPAVGSTAWAHRRVMRSR